MIERNLTKALLQAAERFPVVTVTGPRQSGKTTLCRATFPDKAYISLEDPGQRSFAHDDPRGLLDSVANEGAVLDEIQRAPELVSYLQGIVDEDPRPGRFVLTGSQHFGLRQTISQSLAGRAALLTLLPLSLDEVMRFGGPADALWEVILTGGYPRIHDQRIPPAEWLASYVGTYVERDVRQLLDVGNLLAFQVFLGLCAGRTGQLLNLSLLGADAGVSHNTSRAWLSVLEASYLIFRLPPLHANLGKRLVKTPKLHFYDTGLACYLLGIQTAEQLRQHPLRGALFESWCVAEVLKARINSHSPPRAFFYRDRRGRELDLVLDDALTLTLVEMKSGQTLPRDGLAALDSVAGILAQQSPPKQIERRLIYGSSGGFVRNDTRVIGWREVPHVDWLGQM